MAPGGSFLLWAPQNDPHLAQKTMTVLDPFLQLYNVHKHFGRHVVLETLVLDVDQGEFLFLLGPSGCGKTTLLRLIAGLEPLTAGQILQAGRDVTRLPAAERDFGIVFQSYALFPNLTVAENIAYGLQNRKQGRTQIAARVQELLQLVGLQGLAPRYPAQISGGQQQRVALARALAPAPSLLLLDEPLSALDARVRAGLRGEIKSLQRRLGITTIMVTHDQEEALSMADRIAVMDQGRIVQLDTPLAIYQQPATPFVADFVGQMNFLPGVVSSEGVGVVRTGAFALRVQNWEGDLVPGNSLMLAIRPEEIRIERDAAALSNILIAELQAVEFMGSVYRLLLRHTVPDFCNAAVSLTLTLPRHAAEHSELHVGEALPLHLPADALRVFRTGKKPA
jgi:iron(III) transport system ATP-binding protein